MADFHSNPLLQRLLLKRNFLPADDNSNHIIAKSAEKFSGTHCEGTENPVGFCGII
jgi:hypothetical protein